MMIFLTILATVLGLLTIASVPFIIKKAKQNAMYGSSNKNVIGMIVGSILCVTIIILVAIYLGTW